MGIQMADGSKQPGEVLRYSMEFTPGKAIATGDSLTGTPTVTITRQSDGVNVTNDSVGPPVISGMLYSAATRSGNIVYAWIEGGTSGDVYKITFKCNTTYGEQNVEEDLLLPVINT